MTLLQPASKHISKNIFDFSRKNITYQSLAKKCFDLYNGVESPANDVTSSFEDKALVSIFLQI